MIRILNLRSLARETSVRPLHHRHNRTKKDERRGKRGKERTEPGTPPPFVSMGLDGAKYYTALGEAMRESEDEELSDEMRDAMSAVIEVAAEFYERLQVDVTLTARGIEIDTDVSLAD